MVHIRPKYSILGVGIWSKSCFSYMIRNVNNLYFRFFVCSYFQFLPNFAVVLGPLWAKMCYFGLVYAIIGP